MDYYFFELINQKGNIPLLNQVFITFRNPIYLRYFYILILLLLVIKYHLKGLWVGIAMAATMGLSDLISSHIFKVYFMRLRPCMDDRWLGKINLLVGCPHGYSFTSSHAANNMSVWFFMMLLFTPYLKQIKYFSLLFPCMVGYSQIYVGVHYPIDVAGGLILGACCGWLMHYLYQTFLPKAHQIYF